MKATMKVGMEALCGRLKIKCLGDVVAIMHEVIIVKKSGLFCLGSIHLSEAGNGILDRNCRMVGGWGIYERDAARA